MAVFTEPKVDCHNHIFDPLRFAYQPGSTINIAYYGVEHFRQSSALLQRIA